MIAQSEVFAKPGELMQGELPCGNRFLLSNKSVRHFKNYTEISLGDGKHPSCLNLKSRQATQLFWQSLSAEKKEIQMDRLCIKQHGNIPEGKGLSSSSADVLGILNTLNVFYKANFTIQQLYELAAAIEPTDPCLDNCNLLFRQQKGTIIHVFPAFSYRLIYFDSDTNASVNTVDLSRTIKYSASEQNEYEKLCKKITAAVKNKDYESFNGCLNKSAEMNESFLPKKNFSVLQHFAMENKLGLFVAHSGTYMGLVIQHAHFENVETKAIELIENNWGTKIYTE